MDQFVSSGIAIIMPAVGKVHMFMVIPVRTHGTKAAGRPAGLLHAGEATHEFTNAQS
jgi:hypothetical protein